MGGSVFQHVLGINGAAPQFTPTQFTNDQIMDQVKGGYGKDMADAYKAEVLNQLRNNTFKDAYGVYQNVLNDRAMKAAPTYVDEQSQEDNPWAIVAKVAGK